MHTEQSLCRVKVPQNRILRKEKADFDDLSV